MLDSSGPNGINRLVAVEKVPDAIARLPVDQFNHVMDVLGDLAKSQNADFAAQANAAIGEIRSQMMLRLQEQATKLKGAWNNRGVSQYLNSNSAKLAKSFSPAELERMHTLNRAGHILDVDRTYPGAAAQSHNLAVAGAAHAIKHGMGALGGSVAHGPGFVAGEFVGGKAAEALKNAVSRKTWKKRVRSL